MHYEERLVKYISLLREFTVKRAFPVSGVKYLPCDYKKTGEKLPDTKDFIPFSQEDFWGGKQDSHAWFSFRVTLPEKEGVYRLKINTNLGGWDAVQSPADGVRERQTRAGARHKPHAPLRYRTTAT